MTDTITLTGVVATPPRSLQTASGLSIASFRLASSQRRYDRTRGEWVDAETNWYTVTTFRQLANNVSACLSKGDRVVVAGRLRIRAWENGDRSGTTVEVDADAVGHDLHWGTSSFTRVQRAAAASEPAPEPPSDGSLDVVGDAIGQDPGAVAPAPAPEGSGEQRRVVEGGASFEADPRVDAEPGIGAEPGADAESQREALTAEGWYDGSREAPF